MPINPIAHRLDLMKVSWEKAVSQPVIRWFVKPDELSMVEAFFEFESSEHGNLPDLFFRMELPFESAATYGKSLLNEWIDKFQNDHETLEGLKKDGIFIDWKPAKELLARKDTDFGKLFIDQANSFVEALPDFTDNIIFYLSPSQVNNSRSFEKWMLDFFGKNISPKIKFMICDSLADSKYDYVTERMGNLIAVLSPDLQMDKAMQQAATSGNPAAPDVQFRKCFFQMAEAAAKKDTEAVEYWGAKALEIATGAGWKHLQATAYMLTAGHLLSFKKYQRSLEFYQQSLQLCEKAYAEGDEACGILSIQCLSLMGSANSLSGHHSESARSYLQMAQNATAMNDWLNAMEGWRLAAYSSERSGKSQDAWQYYSNALSSAEKLDTEMRKNSNLLFVGDALLELARYVNKESMIEKINADMVNLAGEDWKFQLEQRKNLARARG